MWTGGSPGNAQSDDDGAIDWICCDGCTSGVMLCALEYVIFMKVMIGCALLVVTVGWSVDFYFFTNSTKADHLLLFCKPLRTFAGKFSNCFWKLLPL